MRSASRKTSARKLRAQMVFADYGKHVHVGFPRPSENLDDFALRIDAAILPGIELDHDLVAGARRLRQHRAGFGMNAV